jgi:two-component system, chemotaxis family, protein-glutamate methylesterase/glutaminase
MGGRDLIVIGGSAGSFAAVLTITALLPAAVGATFLTALHAPRGIGDGLCKRIQRGCHLPVQLARDGAAIERGQVYLAPGGMHLLVAFGCLRVVEASVGDRFRPSIDRLFFSAAQTYGARVIGVVLSGALADGAAGLAAIVKAGGVGVVQSPLEAPYASMPQQALRAAPGSYSIAARSIAPLLVSLIAPAASLEAQGNTAMLSGDDGLSQAREATDQA